MRLSRLFLVYVLSTAAAMAIPFALGGFDYALRSAKPVNSEPALEATPAVYEVANSGNSQYALPACIGHDATEYYGERGYFYADAQTGNKRYFTEDVWSSHFHSCAIGTDGTVYALASTDRGALLNTYTPSGNLKWRISLPEVFSRVALSSLASPILSRVNETALRLCTPTIQTAQRVGRFLWQMTPARPGRLSAR